MRKTTLVIIVLVLCLTPDQVAGQQTTTRTPLRSQSSGFHERLGVGFGFNLGGIPFRNGGPAGRVGDAGGGFSITGGNRNGGFSISGSSGSSTRSGLNSPSVTTLNGYPGYFFAGQFRPFVTGLIPIVGDGVRRFGVELGTLPRNPFQNSGASPIRQRTRRLQPEDRSSLIPAAPTEKPVTASVHGDRQTVRDRSRRNHAASEDKSTATQGALSLAEIRRIRAQRDAKRNDAARKFLDKAKREFAQDNLSLASYYFKRAAREGDLDIRLEARKQLKALRLKRKAVRK